MAVVAREEVTPGLNVFLDMAELADCPGCLSNFRLGAWQPEKEKDKRPFLVVSVDEAGDMLLCVPLYRVGAYDRIELDQSLKTGPGRGWSGQLSFFSRYQFWIIPTECFISATAGEFSAHGARQRYATAAPDALRAIEAHRDDSDTAYHPISN